MTARFLPDSNILLSALRTNAPAHAVCRAWLLEATRADHEIVLCELVECSLLRISTLPGLGFAAMDAALAFWREDLWTYPRLLRVGASHTHNEQFCRFIQDLRLSGNDVNDAWIAALAIEHGATLVSLDEGFTRFPGLRCLNPSA
jgi:toxin-antitoxin system PIN domain toxin